MVLWGKKYKNYGALGGKNTKNYGALGKKGGKMKILVAWNKKILKTVIAVIVQSVHTFLVSVILNRTFDCATVCFWQADIYRVVKEVGIMIVCYIFDMSMVVDPVLW